MEEGGRPLAVFDTPSNEEEQEKMSISDTLTHVVNFAIANSHGGTIKVMIVEYLPDGNGPKI